MNVENVDRIMHANTSMIRAYSQDSLIWGEKIPKYAVRFVISMPSNVMGSFSIWVNDENRPRYTGNLNTDVTVNQGDKIKVTYTLRTSGYKFFSNVSGIEEGILIDDDCYIWIGFSKLDEDIA